MFSFIQKIANISIVCLFIFDIKADVMISQNTNKVPDDVLSQKQIYVNEIRGEFAKEAEKEFDINVFGCGGRINPKVNAITLKFHCDKQVSVNEARWLLVTLQQKFVDKINKHEGIRPFLVEYPFPLIRADIELSFRNNADQKIANIEYVFIAGGKVFYRKICDQKTYEYKDLVIELYEETFKKYRIEDKPKIFKKII
jgi:hypothetical protein